MLGRKNIVVEVEASSGGSPIHAHHHAQDGDPGTPRKRGGLQKMRSFNPFKVVCAQQVLTRNGRSLRRSVALQRQHDFGFNPEVLAAQKVGEWQEHCQAAAVSLTAEAVLGRGSGPSTSQTRQWWTGPHTSLRTSS